MATYVNGKLKNEKQRIRTPYSTRRRFSIWRCLGMISSGHFKVAKVLQIFFVFIPIFGWNYQLRVLVTYLALIGTTIFISVGLAYGIFEVIRTQAWETP